MELIRWDPVIIKSRRFNLLLPLKTHPYVPLAAERAGSNTFLLECLISKEDLRLLPKAFRQTPIESEDLAHVGASNGLEEVERLNMKRSTDSA
jgi:hypothetical protein